jgi:hypothetical protein
VTHQTQCHRDVPCIRTGDDCDVAERDVDDRDAVDFAVDFAAVELPAVDFAVVEVDVLDVVDVADFTVVDFGAATFKDGAGAATALFTGFMIGATGSAACGSTAGTGTGSSSAPCGSASTSEPNATVVDATLGTSGSGPTDVPVMLTPMTPR